MDTPSPDPKKGGRKTSWGPVELSATWSCTAVGLKVVALKRRGHGAQLCRSLEHLAWSNFSPFHVFLTLFMEHRGGTLFPGTGLTLSDMVQNCATPFNVGLFMDVVPEPPTADHPSACRQQALDGLGFTLYPFGGNRTVAGGPPPSEAGGLPSFVVAILICAAVVVVAVVVAIVVVWSRRGEAEGDES